MTELVPRRDAFGTIGIRIETFEATESYNTGEDAAETGSPYISDSTHWLPVRFRIHKPGLYRLDACFALKGQEIITLRTHGLAETTIDAGRWDTGTYILNFRMYDKESINYRIMVIHK